MADIAEALRRLALAKKHLVKVLAAWDDPDWADLTMYGLYCLEAAVTGAAVALREAPATTHWKKTEQAEWLADNHGLPNVSELMSELNSGRKAEAYGDVDYAIEDDWGAEDIAIAIEEFVNEVDELIQKAGAP